MEAPLELNVAFLQKPPGILRKYKSKSIGVLHVAEDDVREPEFNIGTPQRSGKSVKFAYMSPSDKKILKKATKSCADNNLNRCKSRSSTQVSTVSLPGPDDLEQDFPVVAPIVNSPPVGAIIGREQVYRDAEKIQAFLYSKRYWGNINSMLDLSVFTFLDVVLFFYDILGIQYNYECYKYNQRPANSDVILYMTGVLQASQTLNLGITLTEKILRQPMVSIPMSTSTIKKIKYLSALLTLAEELEAKQTRPPRPRPIQSVVQFRVPTA